jgi:DNA-binding NarL/FixJ family response regulator
MNDAGSNVVEREDTPLHPSLVSFLHPAPRIAAMPVEQPTEEHDKVEGTPHHGTCLGQGESAMQVLFVSPPSAFSATVIDVLHEIDASCNVTHVAQLSPEALEHLNGSALALIDLDAFPANGEALIRQMSGHEGIPVVAVSDSLDRKGIDRALDAGAVAFLPKSYAASLVEAVLQLVFGGERYRPYPKNGERARDPGKRGRPVVGAQDQVPEGDPAACLTTREKDVLLEIARGYSSLDIGRHLNMKEGTVKTHLYAIYKKLNVRNRASAALFAASMAQVQQQQMVAAEKGDLNPSWLLPEMTHRRVLKGDVIFRLGDPANELFYVQRGRIQFPELDATVDAGEVFGELGIFSPEHKRTSSAVCETDADRFSLTSEQVRRIYFGNPQFAIFILTLIATRLADGRSSAPERR